MQVGLFVQDTWAITRRFALNFGLRYEYFGPPEIVGAGKDSIVVLGPGSTLEEKLRQANMVPKRSGKLYDSDRNNWAPRIGFSWSPARQGMVVIRGAYGWFYDRPLDNYWQPMRNNGVQQGAITAQDDNGIRGVNYLLPIQAQLGALPGISRTEYARPVLYQPALRDPYEQSAFLGAEWRMTGALTLEADGFASRSLKLVTTDIVNREYTPGYPIVSRSAGRINSTLPVLTYRANQGNSKYGGASLRAVVRVRSGQFHAVYSYSQSHDNQSDALAGNFFNLSFSRTGQPALLNRDATFSRQFDSNADWGNSDFDQRHSLVLYGIWDLNLGRGRIADRVFNGWRLATLSAVRSGFPFSVYTASPSSSALMNVRASVVPSRDFYTDRPANGGKVILNSSAFAVAPNGIGDSRRNQFYGPGIYTVDLSLSRFWRTRYLGERGTIQLRVDAFNSLNHANLGQPDDRLSSSTFGLAQYGRKERDAAFPTLTPFAEVGRQLQLMLRVGF